MPCWTTSSTFALMSLADCWPRLLVRNSPAPISSKGVGMARSSPQAGYGHGRADSRHLQRILLGLPLNRLDQAFALFADVILDFLLDMRGRDEGFQLGRGVADLVAQLADGGGQRLAVRSDSSRKLFNRRSFVDGIGMSSRRSRSAAAVRQGRSGRV